ncbi:MAG: hypothetical protein NVSMB23_25860 [Myxococcales bacterium]
MSKLLLRAAACAALAGGCHARWFPLASAPPARFRAGAPDGALNGTVRGVLSGDEGGYASSFRYELPAPGALLVRAAAEGAPVPLEVEVYGEPARPLASGAAKAGSEAGLTARQLGAGPVFVVVKQDWRREEPARFRLTAVFQPEDPDQANGPYKARAGARPLSADRGVADDAVDYSAMRRTHFWKVDLLEEGALTLRFDPRGGHLTAQLIPPQGAPEAIDPSQGLHKPDAPPGEYFVQVVADGAGDKGRYLLSTDFKAADACKNGGPACSIEGAEPLGLPVDSRTATVDFSRSNQFHFYKLVLKEKGRLTLGFKVLDPSRGAKVAAFILRAPSDAGERILGASRTVDLEPGEVFLKVQATEVGSSARFAVSSIFQPALYISGDVVEIQRRPTCLLTVSAGSNQGVRTAAGCTVVNRSGAAPAEACVVAEVYPNLSKIRPLAPGCRVAPTSKVQIAAQ